MKEHAIQNTIRNDLAGNAFCFRANVGKGWQGAGKPERNNTDKPITAVLFPGDIVLRKARPFDTGLPVGFHDLFGFVPVVITEDMVGETFARFFSMDVKSNKGRMSDAQTAFCNAVTNAGGVSGEARNSQDAIALVEDAKRARRCH